VALTDADHAFFRPSPISHPLAGAPPATRRQVGGDARWKLLLAAVTADGGFLVVGRPQHRSDGIDVKAGDADGAVRRYWHYGKRTLLIVLRGVRRQCRHTGRALAPNTSDIFPKLPVALIARITSFSWMPRHSRALLRLRSLVCSRRGVSGQGHDICAPHTIRCGNQCGEVSHPLDCTTATDIDIVCAARAVLTTHNATHGVKQDVRVRVTTIADPRGPPNSWRRVLLFQTLARVKHRRRTPMSPSAVPHSAQIHSQPARTCVDRIPNLSAPPPDYVL
jgi:hypothetical protein